MRTLHYLPLENLRERYTGQLCYEWFPASFAFFANSWNLRMYSGGEVADTIRTGAVLDAVNRGRFACRQVAALLDAMNDGRIGDDDAILLADFWTPGIEAVFYAKHLLKLKTPIFATNWAQSVDCYDFTYGMARWMQPIEIGYSRQFKEVFVASTVHKQLCERAGYDKNVQVVGLPIAPALVSRMMPEVVRRKQVVYTSRLDSEKRPRFMVQVAANFLAEHPDWRWVVTTSAREFRSNDPVALTLLQRLADRNPRFVLKEGLSKRQYYAELKRSKIQFNCSLQDFVSWTLLEAEIAGCDVCYPRFRSFPECVPASRLYRSGDLKSALSLLGSIVEGGTREWNGAVNASEEGMRRMIFRITQQESLKSCNVWKDTRTRCK